MDADVDVLDYSSPAREQVVINRFGSGEVAVVLPPRSLRGAVLAQMWGLWNAGVFLALTALLGLVMLRQPAAGCGVACLGPLAATWIWGVVTSVRRRASQRPIVAVRRGRLSIDDQGTEAKLDIPYTQVLAVRVETKSGWSSNLTALLLGVEEGRFVVDGAPVHHGRRPNLALLPGYPAPTLEQVAGALRQTLDAAREAGVTPAERAEKGALPANPSGFVPPPFEWPAGVPRTMLRTADEQRRLAAARRSHAAQVARLRKQRGGGKISQ